MALHYESAVFEDDAEFDELLDASPVLAREAPDPDIQTESGRTDESNARRFAAMHKGQLLYCHSWKKWLCWDGTRWKPDDTGRAMKLGMEFSRDLFLAAADKGHDARHFAMASASNRGINATVSLAANLMPVSVDEFDTDPWLLNCPTGTIDLRTGELRDNDPDDRITCLCPTEYDPGAESAAWLSFLHDITCGRPELSSFLQRLAGYCLTGDVSEQVMPVFHGDGANGKSTFLNLLSGAMGTDYAMTAPHNFLMVKKFESHPTELADLFGKRFVVASETEDSQELAESRVKSITGGDSIRARKCRKDFFEFSPTLKLILQTNHKPKVRGTDHAIWRRLLLCPFDARFDGSTRDNRIQERFMGHREAILAWAVEGCRQWQEDGQLSPPDVIRDATEQYRTNEDILGKFIRDRCELLGKIKLSDFTDALAEWSGRRWDKREVGRRLRDHGYEQLKSSGTCFRGISLLREEAAPALP